MTSGGVVRIFHLDELTAVDRGNGITSYPLASGDIGSEHLLTGMTLFPVGGEIPLHTHSAEESVVILEGEAAVDVAGTRSFLRPFDATYVSAGVEHRFLNVGNGPMRILWIYGSNHTTRTFVETGATSGHLDAYRDTSDA